MIAKVMASAAMERKRPSIVPRSARYPLTV